MAYRPRPVSGFPEHLPEIRMIELAMLDKIRASFESFGFAPIETPSVEELDVLLAKGETDKEIYTIERLQADEAAGGEARLGLHYDLTVPFARYVAQHFNDLIFPFKRYQMQRVWRGERPQAGRFREFTQCDIDVIGVDNLALSFDAELAAVAMRALDAIGVKGVTLHLSNRKILSGFLGGLEYPDPMSAIRWLDKIEKIERSTLEAGLSAELEKDTGDEWEEHEESEEDGDPVQLAIKLAQIKTSDTCFVDRVRALGISDPTLDEGLAELTQVIDELHALGIRNVTADLSIARGFDYYTGTVYEGRFDDAPGFGSIVAGGRYDDLAGGFINKKLPGVGISIGFSRLFAKLLQDGAIQSNRKSPADVLVVLPSAERRPVALETAQALRDRGFKVETYHAPQKLSRQLSYAEKKGIPFVWFPPFDEGGHHEVKNMALGEQAQTDPKSWTP
jgi:histidyl-tRNA synthetase